MFTYHLHCNFDKVYGFVSVQMSAWSSTVGAERGVVLSPEELLSCQFFRDIIMKVYGSLK